LQGTVSDANSSRNCKNCKDILVFDWYLQIMTKSVQV